MTDSRQGKAAQGSTELKRLAEENRILQRYKKDLETLLETTDDFIYIKDRQHKFIYTSSAFSRLTGHASWQDLVGKDDFDIFPAEHAERYFAFEKAVIREGKPLRFHEEPYYDPEGNLCWVTSTKNPVFDESGQVIGLVGISKDITQLKRQKEQMEHLADHDDLTSLLNRRAFFLYGSKLIAAAEREAGRISVLYIDLDRFKQINDQWGHAKGDEVLTCFGELIKACTRESDLTSRFGGDEFVVMLKSASDEQDDTAVPQLVQRLQQAVQAHHAGLMGCGCSVGVAHYNPGETLDQLVNRADKAMYQAKKKTQ
ncbi:GGDEF domain-containing protein [Neptuniibacter halophilus]|uniref:GGDEF domain-containing protein n=1 Tax=Neptuniibacter halophilus TaxID=651666 RepID=UPI0025733621|nr:GGDEF domain-containing protein [Neptuniibacter halophilus]